MITRLLSPDEYYYARASMGLPVPSPYQRRWLLPRLLGPSPMRWQLCTWASFAVLPFAAAGYLHARGLDGWRLTFATALLCALPGLRLPWKLPILTDVQSFTLALAVAWSASAAPWWATVPLALVLGATRENAPVFAALWSWSPWPLVGLLAAGWFRRTEPPPKPEEEPWLVHPFREAWAMRCKLGLDGSLYLRPWGATLAALAVPSWQMVITLLVAHAQLFVAMDTLRLTVWAGPVLVLGAAQVIPPAWWPLALAVTLLHREGRAA